ncbi:MAG: hypothetical protein ACYTGX_18000 [Planctomycetota bacterium]
MSAPSVPSHSMGFHHRSSALMVGTVALACPPPRDCAAAGDAAQASTASTPVHTVSLRNIRSSVRGGESGAAGAVPPVATA